MTQIECGRGHLYDPKKYAACPYCNPNQQTAVQPTFPGSRIPVTQAQKTMPPRTEAAEPIPVIQQQKTMPPRGYGLHGERFTPQPEQAAVSAPVKTQSFLQTETGFDPVVGWLACIEGAERGKSFSLRSGVNTIGRGSKMDICMPDDPTISAENHAKLSYSVRNNRFQLVPGESRNIVYCNGEEVLAPRVLCAYDIIDFGTTKLLFVPLCGEQFSWQEDGGRGTV